MKKQLLFLLLFVCTALPGYSQLAAVVDSSVQRGILFSDGASLYEIHTDTLSSVNAATGNRTMLHKLPSYRPQGTTSVTWGTEYNIKTATGFITTGRYNSDSKVWSYTGSSWDTILAPYYTWTRQSAPVQVGTDYVYMFSKQNGSTTTVVMVKTNGTNAGTQELLRADYPTNQLYLDFPLYPNSSPALFSIRHWENNTSTARFRSKIGVVDAGGLHFIDSSYDGVYVNAQLGNTLYYLYGLGGSPVKSYKMNSYNFTTQARSTFISPTTDVYDIGVGFKNKLIVPKRSASSTTTVLDKLISIDPGTGIETVLVDSLGYYGPGYNVSEAVLGTNHLFIPFIPGSPYATMTYAKNVVLSDGITFKTKPDTRSVPQHAFGIARSSFESSTGIICQNELYFNSSAAGSLPIVRYLFRLTGNNVLDSQLTCAFASSFVKVNGIIYFTAQEIGGRSTVRGLWKVTACSSPAAVTTTSEDAQARLYPNPAYTTVQVSLPGTITTATLELYDAMGRCVLTQSIAQQQSVAISQLAGGLYVYRLKTSTGDVLTSGRLSIIH